MVNLDLFNEPTLPILLTELKHCDKLQRRKDLHKSALRTGHGTNKFVAACLINIYSKCGEISLAHNIFNSLVGPNVVLWTSLIQGYATNGDALTALELFTNMDCQPNSVALLAALKACALLVDPKYQLEKTFCLMKGAVLHRLAQKLGFNAELHVANALLDMYSKVGSSFHIKASFFNMKVRDTVTWNSLIHGYVENGQSVLAIDLFTCMDCEPDSFTFVAVLKGLANECQRGREFFMEKTISLHVQAKDRGLDGNTLVATSLLETYIKCRNMRFAQVVFDGMTHRDVVSWTVLILGYVETREHSLALDLFARMDCEPSPATFVAVLKACGGLASSKYSDKGPCLAKGVRIHRRATESGSDTNILVANTLIDMYGKCGSMFHAQSVFNQIINKDTVSWNVLMLGYVENGASTKAIELFGRMDCQPSVNTYLAVLKACGERGELSTGRRVHDRVRKLGLEAEQNMSTSLVDFYSRCGEMAEAREVFEKMQSRDTVSWSALIKGYCSLGEMSEVFGLMKRMQEDGFQPNNVTFLSVLTACSHAGMVEEGRELFESMVGSGLKPSREHFACLVDMFGRADRLPEALELVRDLELEKNFVVWTSLCKL